MKSSKTLLLTIILVIMQSTIYADTAKKKTFRFPKPPRSGVRIVPFHLPLDTVSFINELDKKTLDFSTGIGSGAFYTSDEPQAIYTVSDRGVNIKCKDAKSVVGWEICPENQEGKIFPVMTFTPSIYKFEFKMRYGWQLKETIKLKDQDGLAISGLPNPLKATDTEKSFNLNGEEIAFDPNGVDTEALIKLSDGTYWLADEYAPSLIHVAASGEIIQRLVPESVAADLAGANYTVMGKLPDILKKRKLNRGIESLAVSPNQDYLYFAMQSPLANPDSASYKASRNVRLFKLNLETLRVVGEYVYLLDTPDTFLDDDTTKQNKVKISEMVAVDEDQLIILERVTKTTKLYQVNLKASNATDISGSVWDSVNQSPSLEKADLTTSSITPLNKTILMDSAVDFPGKLPKKLEGITIVSHNPLKMILVNDNDFGIEGDSTNFVMIELD